MSESFESCCILHGAGAGWSAGPDRAALLNEARWPRGWQISVSFLDGDDAQKDLVRRVAREWFPPGRASFVFFTDTDTEVRITFRGRGCLTWLGRTCRRIDDRSRPTMILGWESERPAPDVARRYVLHEFGHVLGLIHEHQKPGNGIHWNRQAVLDELSRPPNCWTEEQIEHNVFRALDDVESNFAQPDPRSIMVYHIPARWTSDGYSVGWNGELSVNDRQFVRDYYL